MAAGSEVHERLEKIEDHLFRADPGNPGLSLRLDRVERLLAVMLKVGGWAAAAGLGWKLLSVVGDIIGAAVGP